MFDSLQFSNRITALTLVSYVFGLLALQYVFFSGFLFMTLCGAVFMISDKYSLFYQSGRTVLQIIFTTFIFGLIHGYTYNIVIEFIKNDNDVWPLFQIYLSFMCVYYYFQFQLNNCFHHAELNCFKAFLIYHSKQYLIANIFSIIEHFLAKYLLNFQYKNCHLLIFPSLIFMVLGEGLRIAAFFTAKSNFTHLVRSKRNPKHQLITHGVYSIFRHPSYTGYFYFCVSSQLFLGNWISSIGFFIVLSKFFNERIQQQQLYLSSFFQKYLYYKRKTYILIPFVNDPSSQDIMKSLIQGKA